MRTITERIAKHIRNGNKWPYSRVPESVILKWAKQYAEVRRKWMS